MPAQKLYEDAVTLTAKVPRALRDDLRRQATENGTSLNAHVVGVLSTGSTTTAATVVPINLDLTPNPTTTPQTTGMTVPSPAPKVIEQAPVKAEVVEPRQDPKTCTHPKSRQRQVVGGKRCMDCGVSVEGFF